MEETCFAGPEFHKYSYNEAQPTSRVRLTSGWLLSEPPIHKFEWRDGILLLYTEQEGKRKSPGGDPPGQYEREEVRL
jgi:hypothetical protein